MKRNSHQVVQLTILLITLLILIYLLVESNQRSREIEQALKHVSTGQH